MRKLPSVTCTLGKLSIDGVYQCCMLERPADGKNVPYKSAINEGRYKLEKRFSPHLNREVIGICDVPGRSDIEIHPANFPWELKGCMAPGESTGYNSVANSENAFMALMDKFQDPVWLTIERAPNGSV